MRHWPTVVGVLLALLAGTKSAGRKSDNNGAMKPSGRKDVARDTNKAEARGGRTSRGSSRKTTETPRRSHATGEPMTPTTPTAVSRPRKVSLPMSDARQVMPTGFTDLPADYVPIADSPPTKPNVVFALHVGSGARCVLKGANDGGPHGEKIMVMELRRLRRLNYGDQLCPFIPILYHEFEVEEKNYGVLEYVHGDNLAQKVVNKTLDMDNLPEIIGQIVLAIQHIHSCKMIFNDLKPDNVMISEAGRVVLIDYGCAVKKNPDNSPIKNFYCGTQEYDAPEKVLTYQVGYTQAADFFSLGVTIFVMYCSAFPFDQHHNTVKSEGKIYLLDFCHRLKKDRPAAALVRALLAYSPDERLGGAQGAADVMAHEYFARFGATFWRDLARQYRTVQYREVQGAMKLTAGEKAYLAGGGAKRRRRTGDAPKTPKTPTHQESGKDPITTPKKLRDTKTAVAESTPSQELAAKIIELVVDTTQKNPGVRRTSRRTTTAGKPTAKRRHTGTNTAEEKTARRQSRPDTPGSGAGERTPRKRSGSGGDVVRKRRSTE